MQWCFLLRTTNDDRPPGRIFREWRDREEVNLKNMRKYALTMVAVLALCLSFAVMGCGQPAEEEAAMPPAEMMSADTTMMDTTMTDTLMSH